MLDIKSIFGNNLKTLRLSLGLSQEEFAEKVGIDDKMISRIEKAHSFTSAITIAKICNGVEITSDQLLKINANFLPDDMSDKEALIKNYCLQLKDLDIETIQFLIKMNKFFLKNYDRDRI